MIYASMNYGSEQLVAQRREELRRAYGARVATRKRRGLRSHTAGRTAR